MKILLFIKKVQITNFIGKLHVALACSYLSLCHLLCLYWTFFFFFIMASDLGIIMHLISMTEITALDDRNSQIFLTMKQIKQVL